MAKIPTMIIYATDEGEAFTEVAALVESVEAMTERIKRLEVRIAMLEAAVDVLVASEGSDDA